MDTFILPATSYTPQSPQARRTTLNTIIEDEPQIKSRYVAPWSPMKTTVRSPLYDDDFPTPRAMADNPRKRMTVQTDFDDLYDVTDDESEEVPLGCSKSVKGSPKSAHTNNKRYPSIAIPSPSAWPTIQKLQKGALSAVSLSPMPQLASPSPKALSMLATRNLQIPSSSSTPSLDGSMTSDEMADLSCPSTPDIEGRAEGETDWVRPTQLHPEAMRTLHRLSTDEELDARQVIEVPGAEMRQVDEGYRQPSGIDILVTPVDDDDQDPLSALSIPSPGGFFASLGSSARHTWCVSPATMTPTTSTAENFYGVPWAAGAERTIEQVIKVADPTASGATDGPPTARRVATVDDDADEVAEIFYKSSPSFEYNEDYELELQRNSAANLDRTGLWLSTQESYLSVLRETNPVNDLATPSIAEHSRSNSLEESTPASAKSVRFIDGVPKTPCTPAANTQLMESAFVEGFEHIRDNTYKSDAFVHSRSRAEAMSVNRKCLPQAHLDALLGTYEINTPLRTAPMRPISLFYTEDPAAQNSMIAQAQKERQALDQIRPAAWVLEATKRLNGGSLLMSPAINVVKRMNKCKILDLGGQSSCDWAWDVALEFPRSTVYTVFTADQAPRSNLEGPANHRHQVIPNYWTLPFPNAHFDLISARSLYALLRVNKPAGRTMDEYDLCLRECMRCLKPGGFLEFSLLDADILHADRQASATSVEFGFCLKNRGYDAAPTKSFLPRLKKAGFRDIRRTWVALPMAQTNKAEAGSTTDASFITGLVGAWAWEKWLLKLQIEMGKDEARLLEGVPAALEEGAQSGAAWRYLTGWARKPL